MMKVQPLKLPSDGTGVSVTQPERSYPAPRWPITTLCRSARPDAARPTPICCTSNEIGAPSTVPRPHMGNPGYMLYQHMLTWISGFAQEAAVVAFDCAGEIEAMRAAYEKRRNLFVESLRNVPGVVCRVPEGAFYSWAYFDHPAMTSAQICDFLLEEARVASVPGEAYGLGGGHCVRFSLATSEDLLQEAAERIGVAMKKAMEGKSPRLAIPGRGSGKSFRRPALYPPRPHR